jgi:enoyl-CoA hydratase/carnithine racemase
MSKDPLLLVQNHGPIRLLTINRPEIYNAWSRALGESLTEELSAAQDDESVKVVVLTGAGEKAFSSGADLNDRTLHEVESVDTFLTNLRPHTHPGWLRSLLNFQKPLIGAINGYTIGAGCSAAISCDILLASTKAEFRFSYANVGVMPIYGGAARLAQWIGRGRAMELVLTGRPLKAEEALSIGLVSRLCSPDKLIEEALELATTLAAAPALAVAMTKESLKMGLESEALRSTSIADTYRFLALVQTKESLDKHSAWREAKESKE